jgi:5-oxopent-3-ene-1,2,5-tricarboxylate decarboxylase/2-hydroxyhepta-2,4-diene-1,7-dioate isomerase
MGANFEGAHMKLARFFVDGKIHEGIVRADSRLEIAGGKTFALDDVHWLPPLGQPGKALGLALNYADHAAELNLNTGNAPILFNKMPNTFIGHKGKIIAPPNIEYMHYENELVVVIGRRGRKVKAADAYDYVLGYTIGNDVTIRDFVTNFYRPPVKAKGFDTFGPMGPWLVTADEIPNPNSLNLRTYVNGELRQQGNTQDFIFGIPHLIEYITEFMTLEPYDMLWTGTPQGISHIYPGDQLRLEIDGIGALENQVVADD